MQRQWNDVLIDAGKKSGQMFKMLFFTGITMMVEYNFLFKLSKNTELTRKRQNIAKIQKQILKPLKLEKSKNLEIWL